MFMNMHQSPLIPKTPKPSAQKTLKQHPLNRRNPLNSIGPYKPYKDHPEGHVERLPILGREDKVEGLLQPEGPENAVATASLGLIGFRPWGSG